MGRRWDTSWFSLASSLDLAGHVQAGELGGRGRVGDAAHSGIDQGASFATSTHLADLDPTAAQRACTLSVGRGPAVGAGIVTGSARERLRS